MKALVRPTEESPVFRLAIKNSCSRKEGHYFTADVKSFPMSSLDDLLSDLNNFPRQLKDEVIVPGFSLTNRCLLYANYFLAP